MRVERSMDYALREWPDWDPDTAISETEDDQGDLTTTSVLTHVAFNDKFKERFYGGIMGEPVIDIGVVAFLRTPKPARALAWTRADLLEEHPIAMRSFATFPPLKTVNLLSFDTIPDAKNRTGVTVRDVLSQVGEWYIIFYLISVAGSDDTTIQSTP